MIKEIALTEFSTGGGCGCKIPPAELRSILEKNYAQPSEKLLVGNSSGDDAAVYALDEEQYLIATTDFFTPIVDNPFDFGRIAAANAISDVYAMGGKPILALSVLAWPTDKLPGEVASEVIRGAGETCRLAGISIAGGHSIRNPEPVFGLAVNGIVTKKNLKQNNTGRPGDQLYLTKALGSGLMNSAMRKGLLSASQIQTYVTHLSQLNRIGELLGKSDAVHAMTDVTGFGIIGHLVEMTRDTELSATLYISEVPFMDGVEEAIKAGIQPGNTARNWSAFQHLVCGVGADEIKRFCDPQTNGGLLVAVDPAKTSEIELLFRENNQFFAKVGELRTKGQHLVSLV